MNYPTRLGLLLILFLPMLSFASPEDGNYWQCTTHDNANQEWTAQSTYQKMALNLAFDSCKKQSKNPATCKTSGADCEGYRNGLSTKPFWRCTALDKTATAWKSNYYSNRDDAALAAKAYCRSKSTLPESCYINFITCMNINDRF